MVEHVFGLLLVNRAGPHERGAKRRMKLLHASVLVTLGGIKEWLQSDVFPIHLVLSRIKMKGDCIQSLACWPLYCLLACAGSYIDLLFFMHFTYVEKAVVTTSFSCQLLQTRFSFFTYLVHLKDHPGCYAHVECLSFA